MRNVYLSNKTISSQSQIVQTYIKLSLIKFIFGIKYCTIVDQALYKLSSQIDVGKASVTFIPNCIEHSEISFLRF